MIFQRPTSDAPIDQGDIIDGCPLLAVTEYDVADWPKLKTKFVLSRIIVLTQACDLANRKAPRVLTALLHDVRELVDQKHLKPADIRGPIRAGRVYGWYFLPKDESLGLPEMLVDFRQVHTVRLDLLTDLCVQGRRLARVQPLYREHLARQFAETYGRIALPEPYQSE